MEFPFIQFIFDLANKNRTVRAAGMPMRIKDDIYVLESIVASGRVLGMVVQLLRQIIYSWKKIKGL